MRRHRQPIEYGPRPSRLHRNAVLLAACKPAFESLESRVLMAAHLGGAAYATIQEAVNAASPGDTIIVDAGNYDESVTIDKAGLKLFGAQATIDARTRNVPAAEESVLQLLTRGGSPFEVQANDVTIDGFTIQGSTFPTASGYGILIAPNTAGTQILDNIVQGNHAGLGLANNSATDAAVISHNVFRKAVRDTDGTGGFGIYSNQFLAGGPTGGTLTNVVIDGNLIDGNPVEQPAIDGQSGGGVYLSSKLPGSQTNVTITNNQLTGNFNAIYLTNTNGATIAGNNISGSSHTQVVISGGDSNIQILNNSITNGLSNGIKLDDNVALPSSNVFIRNNIIRGNLESGLTVFQGEYPGTLDASNNWWGSPSGPSGEGPGTGDRIIADDHNVAFSPWSTGAVVSVSAPSVAYTGQPYNQAIGSAIGVRGEDLGAVSFKYYLASDTTLSSPLASAPVNAGSYKVVAVFAGNADYPAATSAPKSFAITAPSKLTPVFSNLGSPTIVQGLFTTTLAGKLTGTTGVPTGNVSITLNGATQSVALAADGSFSATFAAAGLNAGSYAINYAYAGDTKFGPATAANTLKVVAGSALLQADPLAAGKSAIFIAGTSADDAISIKPGSKSGTIDIKIDNKTGGYSGSFSTTGVARIVVYSGAGNDNVSVDRKITLPAWVFTGGGDDHVLGGGGNDVLVGGGGKVDLQSGPGRSLLIGGAGQAHLKSGGEDILIAGSTRYDNSFAGLGAIMAEWTRTDASYLIRAAHLVLGIPGGSLNGSTLLNNSTVTASSAVDHLEGGSGNDLFFAQLFGGRKKSAADKITGWRWGEVVIPLF